MLRSPTSLRTHVWTSKCAQSNLNFESNRDACLSRRRLHLCRFYHLASNGLAQLFSHRLYNFKQFHCKPHNLLNLLRSAAKWNAREQTQHSRIQYGTQCKQWIWIHCAKARSKNTFQEIKSHAHTLTDNMSNRAMLSSMHSSSSSSSSSMHKSYVNELCKSMSSAPFLCSSRIRIDFSATCIRMHSSGRKRDAKHVFRLVASDKTNEKTQHHVLHVKDEEKSEKLTWRRRRPSQQSKKSSKMCSNNE